MYDIDEDTFEFTLTGKVYENAVHPTAKSGRYLIPYVFWVGKTPSVWRWGASAYDGKG